SKPGAAANDQVLILAKRKDTKLEQTGAWDTLGMRGTCSPGFRVSATFSAGQVLPVPFADICPQTMVPYSHILWSACWLGIATDAVQRARSYVRAKSLGGAGATDHRLADAAAMVQQMRSDIFTCAANYQHGVPRIGFAQAIELNQLKLSASEM